LAASPNKVQRFKNTTNNDKKAIDDHHHEKKSASASHHVNHRGKAFCPFHITYEKQDVQ
jgi:hypothetical protein